LFRLSYIEVVKLIELEVYCLNLMFLVLLKLENITVRLSVVVLLLVMLKVIYFYF